MSDKRQIDKKSYAASAGPVDFGTLTARNQLVRMAVGPILDALIPQVKHDHRVGAETRYTVKVLIVAETDIDQLN
jgi:hypothetical protein